MQVILGLEIPMPEYHLINKTSENEVGGLLRMQIPFEWLMLSLQRGQPPCLPPCGYAEFHSDQNEQLIVCSF